MSFRTGVLFFMALFGTCHVHAAGPFTERCIHVHELQATRAVDTSMSREQEPERLVAAVLAVTLGPFGAHRLYFGTGAKVPIIYGLTFGGFGVLVVIDLAHILFTKDLAQYKRNSNVFMWAKPTNTATTPP